jgi:hypothetical protein
MSRINAHALACLTLSLTACATSQDQPPTWVKAECPPAVVVVDRSFKSAPPECLARIATLEIKDGVTWGDLAVDAVKASRDRDTCLLHVAQWVASEKQADTSAGS